MRSLLAGVAFLPFLLSGCSGDDGVKEFTIHIGWNADNATQYMHPETITVQRGDKVRFVVVNDDDPERDYGARDGFKDSFHDVALDYPGACDRNPIEHEAIVGRPAPVTECNGKDYFVAHAKGTFSIVCEVKTVPSHAERGMRATFIVE